MAIENGRLLWVFPLKMVIFHGYVSLPEGTYVDEHVFTSCFWFSRGIGALVTLPKWMLIQKLLAELMYRVYKWVFLTHTPYPPGIKHSNGKSQPKEGVHGKKYPQSGDCPLQCLIARGYLHAYPYLFGICLGGTVPICSQHVSSSLAHQSLPALKEEMVQGEWQSWKVVLQFHP